MNCPSKLGVNEWLARRQETKPSPLHCMEKSAQAIDSKGIAIAPLCKRVRILLEAKEIGKKGRNQSTVTRNESGKESL